MKILVFVFSLCLALTSFSATKITSMILNFDGGLSIKIQKQNHVIITQNNQVTSESWFGANGYKYWASVKFVKAFQTAVQDNQVLKLSNMVDYPLKINQSKIKSIKNQSEFIKHYSQIFTSTLKEKIIKMNPYRLFCNSAGVMLMHGEIWLHNNRANQLKIYAIIAK